MAAETAQKDTPAPVTVAKGGRGSSKAKGENFTQSFQLGNALIVGVAES